jgi:hypothetical protein
MRLHQNSTERKCEQALLFLLLLLLYFLNDVVSITWVIMLRTGNDRTDTNGEGRRKNKEGRCIAYMREYSSGSYLTRQRK